MGLTLIGATGHAARPQARPASVDWTSYYDQATRNIEARFRYRRVVRGRVTDSKGRGVSGFRVEAHPPVYSTGIPYGNGAVTGPNGRYEIRGLDRQTYSVQAYNDGKPLIPSERRTADLRASKAVRGVDFTVVSGPKITVRAFDALTGAPIPGLVLLGPNPYGNQPVPVATTDERGEAVWRSFQSTGTLSLEDPGGWAVLSPDGRPGDLAFAAESGWSVVKEIRIEGEAFRGSPLAIHGTAVDEKGKPTSGATIWATRGGRSAKALALADAEGRFTLLMPRSSAPFVAPPAEETITVLAERGLLCAERRLEREDRTGSVRLLLKENQRASAFGRIVDENGRPVNDVSVDAEPLLGQPAGTRDDRPWTLTERDGRFTIRGLRPNVRYVFHTGNQGWNERIVSETIEEGYGGGATGPFRAGEARSLGWIFVRHAEATVEGTVVDESGKPILPHVALSLKGARTNVQTFTDARGCFRLADVVDEPLTLRVFRDTDFRDENPSQVLKIQVRPNERDLRLVVGMSSPRA